MKLVFLGDSLTWGGYGGNFVTQVAARLPEHTIVNAGEGGNTVLNLLRRIGGILADEPDGVFVMVGGNDAISYSQPETRPYYAQVQKIPDGIVTPEQFAATYRDLLTKIQLAHTLAWVGLEPAEYSAEVCATMERYNGLARDVARSFSVPTLDLNEYFESAPFQPRPPLNIASINLIGQRTRQGWNDYEAERQRNGYNFTFDGLHFTPGAARQAGDIIADFLRRNI
jgi:lysophospholipase L1-like esterase